MQLGSIVCSRHTGCSDVMQHAPALVIRYGHLEIVELTFFKRVGMCDRVRYLL
jgi:hypothetical protein